MPSSFNVSPFLEKIILPVFLVILYLIRRGPRNWVHTENIKSSIVYCNC